MVYQPLPESPGPIAPNTYHLERTEGPDGSYTTRTVDNFTGRVYETGTGSVTKQPDGSQVDESIRRVYDFSGQLTSQKWVTEVKDADGSGSGRTFELDKQSGWYRETTDVGREVDGKWSYERVTKLVDPESGDTAEQKFTSVTDTTGDKGYTEVTEHRENGRLTEQRTFHSDRTDLPEIGNTQETTVKFKEDGGAVVTDVKNEQGHVTTERKVLDKDGHQVESPLPEGEQDWGIHPSHPEITGQLDDLAVGINEQATEFTSRDAAIAQLATDPPDTTNLTLRTHEEAIAHLLDGLYPNR